MFSLLTGLASSVVGAIDDVANSVDDMLFGYGDGTSQRKRDEIADTVVQCRSAGMSDQEIRDILEMKYGDL